MSAVLKNQKHDDDSLNFITIKENRKLRLLEPDDIKGIRSFRNTPYFERQKSENRYLQIIRVMPWLIAGLILGLSFLM